MKASWWGYFEGVFSLSDLRLAWNVDNLLYDETGLVGFFLLPKLDESSNYISDESSEEEEDEESDKR